ncbi:YpsA SLOG family protein [Spectribacter hydrogenooxidans]|uniref:YpsA SLOG family protein n=1 Tax=Spectribacter hydrogenoxidans TaxID=3075608 RepID=UPI0032C2418E
MGVEPSVSGPLSIISGAQTGVGRGAMDAALDAGIPCGGWVPPGREAEDGRIPDRYPVQEMTTGRYRQRTKANVLDCDGTVLIYFGSLHGGTELTLQFCLRNKKGIRNGV